MDLKNQFKKLTVEEYREKIRKVEEQIKKQEKTKAMWELRLKNKLRELGNGSYSPENK